MSLHRSFDSEYNRIYSFNSPIGYSKKPLIYSRSVSFESGTDIDDRKDGRWKAEGNTASSQSLDGMPFEIRLMIANELSQFDCLNLLQTNKTMYSSTIPRLYQHIVVDQHFSQFSKEFEYVSYTHLDDMGVGQQLSCSYVKSAFGFKKLLSSYIKLYDRSVSVKSLELLLHEDSFPFIRKFQCIDLPDSLNTYDHELNDSIKCFFQRLPHLKELIWLNDNFRLEFLSMIPNTTGVYTLILNIRFSNYLTEFNSPIDSNPEESPFREVFDFSNLRNFSIKPYQNSRRLMKIVNNLLVSRNPEMISRNLKSLKLSRLDKEAGVLIPPCTDLIGAPSTQQFMQDKDLRTIESLFVDSKLQYLHNLSVFHLNNCLLTAEDAEILMNSINLASLKTLELKSISEYQRISVNVTSNEINQHLGQGFLAIIAPHLSNLQHLMLDYREAYTDSVPSFLDAIPSKEIYSLDLIIRFNQTKMRVFDSLDELYDRYAEALTSSKKFTALTKFSIEMKEENPFCDINVPVTSTWFFDQIACFDKLSSLRINPSEKPDCLTQLIQKLPLLEKLEVFGKIAGGPPNLGLGMMHPTVYDEWYKVQHVAILYLQRKLDLKYIKINKCVFECDGEKLQVMPRDGIEQWFDRSVRLGTGQV